MRTHIARISIPNKGTFKMVLNDEGMCIEADPVLDFAINKPRDHLSEYFKSMGWKAVVLKTSTNSPKNEISEPPSPKKSNLTNLSEDYKRKVKQGQVLTPEEIQHWNGIKLRLNQERILNAKQKIQSH